MFKILRIICAVIAAVLVTACIFLAIYISETMVPALGCAAGALLFFVLCLLFKHLQEEKENKESAANAPEIPFDADQKSGEQAPADAAADKDAPAAEANEPQDENKPQSGDEQK